MIASSIGESTRLSFSNHLRASLESGTICIAPYRHSFLLLLPFVTPSLLMHLIVAPVVNPTLPSLWAEPKNYRYLSLLA